MLYQSVPWGLRKIRGAGLARCQINRIINQFHGCSSRRSPGIIIANKLRDQSGIRIRDLMAVPDESDNAQEADR